MVRFVRTRFKVVCFICFLMTSGAGVMALMYPGVIHFLAGKTMNPEAGLFFYQFGFILVAIVGVWFLIIMTNPDDNKPLLILATAEKFTFVAFLSWAMFNGTVGWLFSGIALGDLLMGLACLIYLALGDIKQPTPVTE